MNIVAPALAIVGPQDRLQVGEQARHRQELADRRRDVRHPPQAAPDHHLEAQRAVAGALQVQADVVGLGRRAVLRRRGHRDLELARQPAELRMHRRPLADRLGPRPRVIDFLGRRAGIGVGRDVADAVAAGLDGVHVHLRQVVEDVRRVAELDPVQLQVGARGEVAVALVIGPRDPGQFAQLRRVDRAIGNGDPQHIGVELQIEAVAQAQGLELFLVELAGQPPRHLAAELRAAVGQDILVDRIVPVHRALYLRLIRSTRPVERAAPWACSRASTAAPPSACLP